MDGLREAKDTVFDRGRRWRARMLSVAQTLFLCGFGLVAVVIVSCAPPKTVAVTPPPSVPTEKPQPCVPRNLTLDSTGGGYALIAWDPGCPQERILRGFNIYVSSTPLNPRYPDTVLPASIQPFNRGVYPGDTLGDPNRETFALENIPNAVRQYVHVRVVYTDGRLSIPSNEIEVICYQQGVVELAASFSGSRDGFIFRKETYCRTDDLDNDLYFYSKNGEDFFCSPSRLGQVNRVMRLYPAGKGIMPANLGRPSGPSSDRIKIRPDENIIAETADGDIVGIRVKQIDNSGKTPKISFEYLLRPAGAPGR
jgi:hypothetical protein